MKEQIKEDSDTYPITKKVKTLDSDLMQKVNYIVKRKTKTPGD